MLNFLLKYSLGQKEKQPNSMPNRKSLKTKTRESKSLNRHKN